MTKHESNLLRAERQVREAEARITRQIAIIGEMDRDNHPQAAALGRAVLATYRQTLDILRTQLRQLREAEGAEP